MIDVLEITQVLEAEGVTIAKSDRSDRRDACVADDEALPLPRCCRQPEQMAHENTVRPRVCDEGDLLARFFDVPERQLAFDPVDPTICKKLGRTSMDTSDEVANWLSPVESMPTVRSIAFQLFAIGLDGHL